MDFGGLSKEEEALLTYKDRLTSFIYVTKLSFGEINEAPFFMGNMKFTGFLILFFYVSVLILLIGFLNILIAIMASVYNERNEVAD